MFREENNTVVVGASVAGLFAAYKLAQAGERVQVYEAQAELMSEARTLIVTPAWLDLFDFDASAAVLNRTRIFELYSPGASARIPLREPDVIMERATFLRLLAREVRAAGGELIMGHRFEGLTAGGGTEPLTLRFRNGQGVTNVDATTVIGADGVHSAVAHAVGRDGLLDEVTLLRRARAWWA
jgi:flavin-dependent dehydrogenase